MAKYVWSPEQCAARSARWQDETYRRRVLDSRRKTAISRVPARFWPLVDKSDECWVWNGLRDKYGYGRFTFPGRHSERAHRVAWFLAHGEWPPLLRHKCDNPPCCNPDHLETGTHADNAMDKVLRGRAPSKLTPEQVYQIRSLEGQLPYTQIGALFGIGGNAVSSIIKRRSWSHLPEELAA